MTREEARTRIEAIGIFPGIRVGSADQALYCAEILYASGIPIAEIPMTVPDAVEIIRRIAREFPDLVIGAGTVLDSETAYRCIDAGARFITSTGLIPEVVAATLEANVVAIPGGLTPTEVIACWKAGGDYVKIFPAASLGGDLYIRSLRLPLPQIPLIAAGGVSQQTAEGFVRAGASALGVGMELLPKEAVAKRQNHRIQELARRFLGLVQKGRSSQ
ncbi:bifunctional 4-hydroxy-2-oxoglutarate aldolase/2-dehydro-3-deoxy-phosphogluconate aldolase [Telmatobacter sp. DSM 110680]|uniref:Bifunctional 4-hydroxy-2-oxoglutarate aldolase/2-dehydro-3-deoxy-phosphogluconate aldolase n=1 Tax=Telmatobacter sp. DSM 110680 TaxID=3036704 RepID=A0AAU7DQD2_9BACT